ncbi:MAG TPA: molybdopterin oxidoreductase [Chryseosolibacter sp.]
MHVQEYLGLVKNAEENLARAYKKIAMQHMFEPDVTEMCEKFALWSEQHLRHIEKLMKKFDVHRDDEADDLSAALFPKPRMGGFGMLRDLHGLWLLVHEAQICWIVLFQAAQAMRDAEMEAACRVCGEESKRESMWLLTKIKASAPQAMVVAQ